MFYFIIIIYCNFGLLEKLQEKIYLSVKVTISTEIFNWNWKSHCTPSSFCWKNLSSFSLSQLLFTQIKSLYIFIVVSCSFLSSLEGNLKRWSSRVISCVLWSGTLGLLGSRSNKGNLFLHHVTSDHTAYLLSFLTLSTVHREGVSD